MTLDAGPMCPYCFTRGDHLPSCKLIATTGARYLASIITLKPKDKT